MDFNLLIAEMISIIQKPGSIDYIHPCVILSDMIQRILLCLRRYCEDRKHGKAYNLERFDEMSKKFEPIS